MELIYVIAYFAIGFIISSIITRYYDDFGIDGFVIMLFGWVLVIPVVIFMFFVFCLLDLLKIFMIFIRGRN
ncbi:hypothetical protein [Providencia phage PSTCR6]|nr:hypothetical protein [Providencia phage PSTCR6]